MVLGLYYMTRDRINALGEGMTFSGVEEVHRAYENHVAGLHARVTVRVPDILVGDQSSDDAKGLKTKLVETTVGRALLSEVMPEGLSFDLINQPMNKRAISEVINACYRQLGIKETVVFADQLMYTGFNYATRAGVSFGVNDMVVPKQKPGILDIAEQEVKDIQDQYASGLVTDGERYNKVVDIWSRTNDQVAKAMMEKLGSETVVDSKGDEAAQESFNSILLF